MLCVYFIKLAPIFKINFTMMSEERDENQVAVATRFTFRPNEVIINDLIPSVFLEDSLFFIHTLHIFINHLIL